MVAVVRYEDPGLLRGFDDERALGDAHERAVDGEVDEIVVARHHATIALRRPAM